MFLAVARWVVLGAVALSGLYCLAVVFSARRFFSRSKPAREEFTPPLTLLKPVLGLEPKAYENFASFCRQDYPEYEILFGVASEQEPVVSTIRKLIADFPQPPIRLLVVDEKRGSNHKVSRLCGLEPAARHDILVVSDGDIRVGPDYLRSVAAPFSDPRVAAVTSLYTGISASGLWTTLEAINLSADFMPAVLVARSLEGVRFALGATIAVRRERLAEIGGFEALASVAADDHDLGRRLWACGHQVELVNAGVQTVCSTGSWRAFFDHHLRWAVMNRQSRPWGYMGYVITLFLPWALTAAILAPTRSIGVAFVAGYAVLRAAAAWTVGVRGLHDPLLKRRWWLVPLWDVCAFVIWLSSLFRSRVRWRGVEYCVTEGRLVPAASLRDTDPGL